METKTIPNSFVNNFTSFCKSHQLECMPIRCIEKSSTQLGSHVPYLYQPSMRLETVHDQKYRLSLHQWKIFSGTLDALSSTLPSALDLTELRYPPNLKKEMKETK
ncbi:hypothetical protein HMI54_008344 [Coelomomyces lativittatus]|nr:hypothetical protein HMI54_008344 [Coelomomyces lativittatus]